MADSVAGSVTAEDCPKDWQSKYTHALRSTTTDNGAAAVVTLSCCGVSFVAHKRVIAKHSGYFQDCFNWDVAEEQQQHTTTTTTTLLHLDWLDPDDLGTYLAFDQQLFWLHDPEKEHLFNMMKNDVSSTDTPHPDSFEANASLLQMIKLYEVCDSLRNRALLLQVRGFIYRWLQPDVWQALLDRPGWSRQMKKDEEEVEKEEVEEERVGWTVSERWCKIDPGEQGIEEEEVEEQEQEEWPQLEYEYEDEDAEYEYANEDADGEQHYSKHDATKDPWQQQQQQHIPQKSTQTASKIFPSFAEAYDYCDQNERLQGPFCDRIVASLALGVVVTENRAELDWAEHCYLVAGYPGFVLEVSRAFGTALSLGRAHRRDARGLMRNCVATIMEGPENVWMAIPSSSSSSSAAAAAAPSCDRW